MNLLKSLHFNESKPATAVIYKSEKINYLAVGLLKEQMLKKHQTSIPTLLTVIKGKLEFTIGNNMIVLNEFDTYHIPVLTEHEVKGTEDQNLFTLIQEKA